MIFQNAYSATEYKRCQGFLEFFSKINCNTPELFLYFSFDGGVKLKMAGEKENILLAHVSNFIGNIYTHHFQWGNDMQDRLYAVYQQIMKVA